jgi:hypothetical protein
LLIRVHSRSFAAKSVSGFTPDRPACYRSEFVKMANPATITVTHGDTGFTLAQGQ